MARHSYKTALRAKGIRPIPPHHRLRSYRGPLDETHQVIASNASINFTHCRGDAFCRCRSCKPGRISR